MQQLKFVEEDVPSDSDDEGIASYKIGGYHPAFIGEVFHNRYVVIHKLGWGQFSTVWIAKDFKTQLYVALKIQKSAPKSFETALDEVEILQRIQKKGALNIVKLLNAFMIQGPFGNHLVLVFELLGVSLQEVIKTYQGLTFDQCRSILRQILIALDFLHRVCGLIHTDIKPENILICLGQEQIQSFVDQGQLSKRQKRRLKQRQHEEMHLCPHHRQQQKRLLIKIADLGNACWVHHHFSEVIQTLPYRAPEVTLGAHYGTSVDIWSMGCLAFELVTGEVLFKETTNESHLLKIHNMIGSLKGYVGKYSKQYQPLFRECNMSLEKVLKNKYQIEGGFCDFLRAMLEIKPYERATAEQLLAHPWLNGGNTIRRLRIASYDSSREEDTESD